jgi:hypothetical protein
MIELTQQQSLALDREKQPAAALDPRTGQVYRLIRQDIYEIACNSLKSQAWGQDDDGDEDLIRKRP